MNENIRSRTGEKNLLVCMHVVYKEIYGFTVNAQTHVCSCVHTSSRLEARKEREIGPISIFVCRPLRVSRLLFGVEGRPTRRKATSEAAEAAEGGPPASQQARQGREEVERS